MQEWTWVPLHAFLTSASDKASHPDRFISGERGPGTHLIGGWVGSSDGLDAVKKRNISEGFYFLRRIVHWKSTDVSEKHAPIFRTEE
jgi:hypothetical protein